MLKGTLFLRVFLELFGFHTFLVCFVFSYITGGDDNI